MSKKELTEEQKLSLLLKEMTDVANGLSDKLRQKQEELQKEIQDHKQTKIRHNVIYEAKNQEVKELTAKIEDLQIELIKTNHDLRISESGRQE